MKTKKWFPRPIITKCRSKVLQNAPREHSAILSTFIKLPFVFKTFVLSLFEWPLKTGFTVSFYCSRHAIQEMCCSTFTPNDTLSNGEYGKIKVLTGPNACGKSVYLKQVGFKSLYVLLLWSEDVHVVCIQSSDNFHI